VLSPITDSGPLILAQSALLNLVMKIVLVTAHQQ